MLFRSHFPPDATEELIRRARDGKQSITAVVDALLKDYQFGLGLIRKNTGQTEFEIPLAALDAPDKFLSEWVVSSYKKA